MTSLVSNSYTAWICACCSSEFSVSVSEGKSVDKRSVNPGNNNGSSGSDDIPPTSGSLQTPDSNPESVSEQQHAKGSSKRIRAGEDERKNNSLDRTNANDAEEFEGRSVTDSEEDTLYGSDEIKIEVDCDPVSFPDDDSGGAVDVSVEELAEGQLSLTSNDYEYVPGASKQQQQRRRRLPPFSKEKIPAILSLLFEYPWILREEETVFKCSSAEVDIIFCDKCETALFNLYSMFRRFIKLLKNDGKVWNLLRRVGCSGDEDTQALIRRLGLGKYRRRASGKRKKQSRRGKQSSTTAPKKVKGDVQRKKDVAAAGSAKTKSGGSGGTPGRLTERQKKLSAVDDIQVVEESEEPADESANFPEERLSGSEGENQLEEDEDEDFDPELLDDDSNDPTFRPANKSSTGSPEPEGKKRRGRPPGAKTKVRKKTPTEKVEKKKRIRIRNQRKEHWEEIAKKDPNRTCDVCGNVFLCGSMMRNHKLTVHEGKKPFECEHCGKGFTQKIILKQHTCDYSLAGPDKEFLRIKREEQLFRWTCEVCGKRFKLRSALFVHQKNHGEESHKCDKCDKVFKRKDHLKAHVRIVHNTGKRFVCSTCGDGFKTTQGLKQHERRHANPNEEHVCSICGKSIKTLSQMGRHLKTHEEVLPFECHICGKRFKMKDYLGQHLRKGKTCGSKAITQSQSQQAESSSSINRETHSGSSAEATTEFNSSETFQQQQQQQPGHAQLPYQRPGPSFQSGNLGHQFGFF